MKNNNQWYADDGSCEEQKLTANSEIEAAEKFFDGYDYDGPRSFTRWVTVSVWQLDEDGERINESSCKFTIDAEEPDCTEESHSWGEDIVTGSGGGVKIENSCKNCGLVKKLNTWGQDPEDGQQVSQISYEAGNDAHTSDEDSDDE